MAQLNTLRDAIDTQRHTCTTLSHGPPKIEYPLTCGKPPCSPECRNYCPENIRDVTFGEDTAISGPAAGPANLTTVRAAIIAALKDAGYLHIPEGRRDHITPAEALRLHGLD